MQSKGIRISVVDGQGGGIGRNIVGKLRKIIPANSNIEICALGTNSMATSNMLRAGADVAATGENAIVRTAENSDIIMGPIAIIIANSMLGELTPVIAAAIGSSSARKILIPLNKCNVIIAADRMAPTDTYIDHSIKLVEEYLEDSEK